MNEQDRKQIGRRVKNARTSKGWSKQALAKKVEITTTTLKRIEDGLRVQDAKLQLVLGALGLALGQTGQEAVSEEQVHPGVFLLPPEVERGYLETVKFSRAVSELVPSLDRFATRLMVDAANLFAACADALLADEQEALGGDGNADDDSGGSAPTIREVKPWEENEAAYDPDAE